ncbi:MAG: PQQ-dependent sugar dehydrogenase [Chitinophagaceae bacterium]
MRQIKPLILLLLLVPFISSLSCSDIPLEPPGAVKLQTTVITQNLQFPWEIAWGPDNFIWMTEKFGRISRVNPATGVVTPLIDVPLALGFGLEAGLLGMAVSPDFTRWPYVFIVHTFGANAAVERVERYTYSNGTLINPLILVDGIVGSDQHDGSRLVIVGDKLFISTGDAQLQRGSDPQSSLSLNGKILRINFDGSIPVDNPDPHSRVWSRGHRNPQGLVFANDHLYSTEHGGYDEVNLIKRGKNYGWPLIDGIANTTQENEEVIFNQDMTNPIKEWASGTAPSGMDYYNNNAIPQWKNALLVASLKAESLYEVKLNPDNETVQITNRYYQTTFGRLRDVCVSPGGDVYMCTSNGNNQDKIIRVSPITTGRKEM